MSESKLKAYIEEATPIIESFLAKVLQKTPTLQLESPQQVQLVELSQDAASRFTIVSKESGDDAVTIQLSPNWIPLVSQAMLGTAMTPEDTGVGDLTNQLVSQGYGALRTNLSSGAQLPEISFDAFNPGGDIPEQGVSVAIWKVSFSVQIEEETYEGSVFMPESVLEAASAPSEPAAAAPKAEDDAVGVSHVNFPEMGRESEGTGEIKNFDLLAEVELIVTVELGRRRIPLSEVLQLTTGSVIELEKLVGEPLEIFANGRLIAEGEAVVVDEQFGVRITNLASATHRANAFA